MFVSFEGVDGSGKSTQATLLCAHLQQRGRVVVAVREPGGTELGERVRSLVLEGGPMTPWAEAALFAAARAELVETVVRPALARGADVICDRFLDSSVVYQGIGRELGVDEVLRFNLAVTRGLLPERTFVLLAEPAVAHARLTGVPDRIERESAAFRATLADGYASLVSRFRERVQALDATLPAAELAAQVRSELGV